VALFWRYMVRGAVVDSYEVVYDYPPTKVLIVGPKSFYSGLDDACVDGILRFVSLMDSQTHDDFISDAEDRSD